MTASIDNVGVGSAVSGTTVTVTAATGVTAADVILGYILSGDFSATTTITMDSSMTALGAVADLAGTGYFAHCAAFHNNGVNQSAVGSYTQTMSNATISAGGYAIRCLNSSGADTTAGIGSAVYAGASGANAISQVTTTVPDCLVICVGSPGGGATLTTPSGWTQFGIYGGSYVWYKTQAAAGATGTPTTTISATNDLFIATFAAKPSGPSRIVVRRQAVNRAGSW